MTRPSRRMNLLWIILYIVFALAPLILMLFGPRPMGRAFLRELSIAFGFTGIGLMALHFALTARIAAVDAPYGSDVVYYFHHKIAYFTLFLWLAHPLLLIYQFGWNWGLLNIFAPVWRQRWGILSVVAILALMIWAISRRRLTLEYVTWRIWHGALALVAMLAVMTHAYLVGRYIGTPLKQALWLAYGGVSVALVAYLRVYTPWRSLRRPYRVAQVRRELGETHSLILQPVGHRGSRFAPGQFAWLTARHSPFSLHEHPFSYSSSAERRDQVAFAIKSLGDFTRSIETLPVGTQVYIDGPYGSFSPDRHEGVEQLVLIAGGVGIAPMMSILHTLADRHDPRPVLLLYGVYDFSWASFREELAALEARLNLRVVYVLERPPADWQGERGYVTREMLARYLPPAEARYHVYLCGPVPMLDALERALDALGVPAERVIVERFDLA